MAALQTRKLVGLTVGLPVSVRCILTLFARHFLAMCPCSVCVPTFYSLPSLSPHRVYAYIYIYIFPRVSQPTIPLWYPRRIFFLFDPSSRSPFPFAFCLLFLCRFRLPDLFQTFQTYFIFLGPPRRPFWYPTRIVWISLAFLPLKIVVLCFFLSGRRKRWTDTTTSSNPVSQ